MKVYLLEINFDDSDLTSSVGIFSTPKKAKEFCKKFFYINTKIWTKHPKVESVKVNDDDIHFRRFFITEVEVDYGL